jgi:hypothetical protein
MTVAPLDGRVEQGAGRGAGCGHERVEASPDRSNWLPAPAGRFRPILRMYQPQKAILDGTYVLPPVRKVG